jgi:hypothetical protein
MISDDLSLYFIISLSYVSFFRFELDPFFFFFLFKSFGNQNHINVFINWCTGTQKTKNKKIMRYTTNHKQACSLISIVHLSSEAFVEEKYLKKKLHDS